MIAKAKNTQASPRDGIATMKEAMAFLSRSRDHVERLIAADEIIAVKDGRLWAIDWESLHAYKDRLFAGRKRKVSV